MILCFRWFPLSNYYKTEIVTWRTWNVTISRLWCSRLGAATNNEIVTWISRPGCGCGTYQFWCSRLGLAAETEIVTWSSLSSTGAKTAMSLFFLVPPLRGAYVPPIESSSPWGGLPRKRQRAPPQSPLPNRLSSRWWCPGPDDDSLVETNARVCEWHVVE